MIRVVLFARIREELGAGKSEVSGEIRCVSDVVTALSEQHGPTWRETLTAENVRVAVNQTLVGGDHAVIDGDEVAFFPPVTGG